MEKSTMIVASKAANCADGIFTDAYGFSLSDDEVADLTNAIYRIFNASRVADGGQD